MSVWEMFRMSYFRVLRLRTQKQEGIAIYYGCADTVTGLAFTTVNELMEAGKYVIKTELLQIIIIYL